MQTFERWFLVAVFLTSMAGPAVAADATGEWLVADGTARIRIEPCNNALWGVIAWTKTPGKDENNPDPAKRDRSVIGLPILLEMKKVEPNRWQGAVYNAENGKTYSSNISLVRADVLRIEGCVFGGLFCGGENWTRVGPAQDHPQPAAKHKDVCP
jgi:uncharacterized protein (DUF2147 family)